MNPIIVIKIITLSAKFMPLHRQKEIQANFRISVKSLLIDSNQNSKIPVEINRFVNKSTFSFLVSLSLYPVKMLLVQRFTDKSTDSKLYNTSGETLHSS